MDNKVSTRCAWTRMGLTLILVMLSLVFFISKTHATVLYDRTNMEQSHTCWFWHYGVFGSTENCDTSTEKFSNSNDWTIVQDIYLTMAGKTSLTITEIDVQNYGSANTNLTGYILSPTDYAYLTSHGGQINTYIQATTNVTQVGNQAGFIFGSPYTFTSVLNDHYYFVIRYSSGSVNFLPSWYNGQSYPFLQTVVDRNAYNMSLWAAGSIHPSAGALFGDLGLTIYTADYLTFTYPVNNTTVTGNLTLSGNCTHDVDLELFNGVTYASSTEAFGISKQCLSNQFNWQVGYLNNGYWSATASSSGELAGLVFYYFAQSVLPPITPTSTPTSSTALINSILGTFSCNFLGILDPCQISTTLERVKPYGYFVDAFAIIQSAMSGSSYASNTSTIPALNISIGTSTDAYKFNASMFDTTTMTKILNQNTWDNLRPYFTIGIGILLLVYFYRRFIQ